jgi:hypothetical protein
MGKTYKNIGVQIPQIWLPKAEINLTKWAVVACDQYTAEPEYWELVEKFVGDAPSTLRLILPEVYLGKSGENERIRQTQASMQQYLDSGLLEPSEGMIYVERTVGAKIRRGLVLALDLEQYDYSRSSQSLIRASEGTIVERLPPRMHIREGALLELPHILVLIDDPQRTVIEPLSRAKDRLVKRYDFDLMMDSGHLAGYQVNDPGLEAGVVQALEKLADPAAFAETYGTGSGQKVLLYAMGAGNHSLAAAKAVWEKMKSVVNTNHPARYALVEIENVHDEGLQFEPIHRVLFGLKSDLKASLQAFYGEDFSFSPCQDFDDMKEQVDLPASGKQAFGLLGDNRFSVVSVEKPSSNLIVGSLQPFLDDYLREGKAVRIDYLHGEEVLRKLSMQAGNAGFYLPGMRKSDLFKTVILDGALPRKTFSMGEAHEKRFYMECRKIM